MELKNYFAQDAEGNAQANPSCYLYMADTTNLINGLTDAQDQPITNPFVGDGYGLIQFKAPNGIYDLRVISGNRDYKIRVQAADVTELIDGIDEAVAAADTATAAADTAETNAGIADTAATNATNARDDAESYAVDVLSSVTEVNNNRILAQQAALDAGNVAETKVAVLRGDLAANSGSSILGTKITSAGSVPTTVGAKLNRNISATLDFGADNTGATNATVALLAFYTAALSLGGQFEIPEGDYLVTPGVLDFSSNWVDKPFPHIKTAGHAAVRFIAASDVDKPMLRINNGTATAAQYKLWRGGSHGGITFVDSFTSSSATGRHGLAIYGFGGTKFGYMCGKGLRGDLLHFERKMYATTNPDPYNVSFCEFEGVESNGSLGYGINNNNSVGVTHCRFKFIRVVDGVGGGIRGLGAASEYTHISIGNQMGWAIDVPFDTLVSGRTTIRLLELDNCEKCYNIQTISGLDILESRIVHRYQSAPNTSAVYWPTVSYNISPSDLTVTSLNIKGFHRTSAGGPLASIGQFVNCNNSVNLRGCKIDLDISDNGSLGILDTQLVTGLNRNSLDVIVTNRGKKVASTSNIIGAALRGLPTIQIGTTGFSGEASKMIFTTELYDAGNNYDTATGYFTAPYTGMYRVNISLTTTMAAGSRIRLGLNRVESPSYLIGYVGYATTSTAQTYQLSRSISLNSGDRVFLMADQNTGSAVNLTGIIDAAVENAWSIDAMQ